MGDSNHLGVRAAAVLLLLFSMQLVAAEKKSVIRPHKHVPRMQPMEQKQRYGGKDLDGKASISQVAPPVTPLLPECVPKYVSNLVVPPPMPVATRPLGFKEGQAPTKRLKRRARKSSDEGSAAKLQSVVDDDAAEYEEHLDVAVADAHGRSLLGFNEAQVADQIEPVARKHKHSEDTTLDQQYAEAVQRSSEAVHRSSSKDSTKVADSPQEKIGEQATASQVGPQDNYHISVRQIAQTVLPPTPNALPQCPAAFAPTNVFAYGPADVPNTPFHNWPGFTIEAKRNVPAHIKWTNDLRDANFNFLPHILKDSIDQTLHWANPAQIGGSTDHSPCDACVATNTCATDPACVLASTTTYTGPVPIVTHVHGQNDVYSWSDGYAEAWYTPNAFGLQGKYKSIGTWYETMEHGYVETTGLTWSAGSAVYVYNNTQRAAPLWYHDHTLGLTRTNVYAGLAGFYFVREKFPSIANGPELPGLPFPAYDGVIDQTLIRELPLAIQDRAFTTDSQLWYPVSDLPSPPSLPNGPVPPRWIPEFSATVPVNGVPVNMIMWTVNGRTYPKQTVYPDAYRLRILNGCNSRTVQLRFALSALAQINPLDGTQVADLLPFWVVGNDGGFYPELQEPITALEMGPAERYDIVIDFTGVLPGQFVFMLNNGPETDTAIYDGTNNGVGLTVHTAQIMRFDVAALPAGQKAQPFNLAQQIALNAALIAQWAATVPPLVPTTYPVRRVTLMEKQTPAGIPYSVLLGVANSPTTAVPTPWMDPVTTNNALNVLQYWDIINLSADSHPIHLHDVAFRYISRTATIVNTVDPWSFTETTTPVPNQDLDGQLIMPCASDPSGQCSVLMDTIIVLPGSTTRIAFFGPPVAGLHVWHCHLVEHEDNDMMVNMCSGQPNYVNPKTGLLMCPGPN